MELFLYLSFTLLSMLSTAMASESEDLQYAYQKVEQNETGSRILSRKKRFLVFPDGSSVQIVFETQNHGYMQVGDIVWFSETAALAWELPTDPEIYLLFKKGDKEFRPQRRQDVNHFVYYLDEKGKLLEKVKYNKKFIVPVFGKRSVDNKKLLQKKIDKQIVKKMHEDHKNNYYNAPNNVNDSSLQFHRNKRTDLYEKLEMYLDNLGWKGKDCVLKMLCESGKDNKLQGSFVEEILRALFTLPQGKKFDYVEHQEYDKAHNTSEDCKKHYPDCGPNGNGLPPQFLNVESW